MYVVSVPPYLETAGAAVLTDNVIFVYVIKTIK